MTPPPAGTLQLLRAEDACECLSGKLWQSLLGGAAWTLLAISLTWLLQAAQAAAPAPVWWKSLVSLACVLATTHCLRVARRLDAHAKQGWTISDAALLLTGAFMTAVFVMRIGPLVGAGLLATFLLLEGLSLRRLKLLPKRWSLVRSGPTRPAEPDAVQPQIFPLTATGPDTPPPSTAAEKRECEEDLSIAQQLTRRETESGVEITGFARGQFEAGQALSSIDLAFCPTLKSTPSLDFELLCDQAAEVNVATLQPFGARLELKRRGDLHEALHFTLELHITAAENREQPEAALAET